MALHKIVNGVRVDLTPEEEEKTLAEWEKNRLEHEAYKEMLRLEAEKKEKLKQSAKEKLMASGLTQEEVEMLIK